jgi:hypothetical protein
MSPIGPGQESGLRIEDELPQVHQSLLYLNFQQIYVILNRFQLLFYGTSGWFRIGMRLFVSVTMFHRSFFDFRR